MSLMGRVWAAGDPIELPDTAHSREGVVDV
jgi:hypothetical protein